MLNVYISNIILNKKDKTKTIQLKTINKEKVKKKYLLSLWATVTMVLCVLFK